MAPLGVSVQSAGSSPTGTVHPRALAALQKAGVATDGLYSKSWNDLKAVPDVVVTLCADAAGEACPVYFGTVVRSHWGMPGPAKATGDEDAIVAAFDNTLEILRTRVRALARLPFEGLKNDGQDFKKRWMQSSLCNQTKKRGCYVYHFPKHSRLLRIARPGASGPRR